MEVSTMSEDGDAGQYTPPQFREYQEGYGDRDPDVHEHAALVRNTKQSRFLSMLSDAYDPAEYAQRPDKMPGHYTDLELTQSFVKTEATEVAREAMEHGDMPTLKHMTGDAGQRADVSGLKAIDTLKSFMTGPAPMFYEWAEPGTGKTNFALLLAQLWKQEHDRALIASNIRTLRETDTWEDNEGAERDGWLSSFGELNEWLKQDGDPMHNAQTPKLFIFDEASSNAGGSGEAGYQTKSKMGPLAYKIRKYGGSLIVIGHDGKDVHPLIRELGVCVHKEGLKSATFYEDVKNRRGVGEIEQIEGIPETDYRYDDKEPTSWSWSSNGDADETPDPKALTRKMSIYTVITSKEADPDRPNHEIADFVPFSTEWVRQRWNEYHHDGKHRDVVADIENTIA